jgi:hypothetical protein
LNGEPNSLKRKHASASIAADVNRFCHKINTDEVSIHTAVTAAIGSTLLRSHGIINPRQ